MDQQRRMLLFVTLSVAILMVWNTVVLPIIAPLPPKANVLPTEELAESVTRPVSALFPANVLPEIAPAPLPAGVPNHPLKTVTLGSLDPQSGFFLHVELTSRGAAVDAIELNDPRYPEIGIRNMSLRVVGHDLATDEKTFATACEFIDAQLGKQTLETMNWEIVRGSASDSSVQFRIVSPDSKLELTKQFDIQKLPAGKTPDKETRDTWAEGYLVKLALTVRNLASEPLEAQYDLRGPVGLPLEDPENAYKSRDIRLGFLNSSGGVDASTYSAKQAVTAKDKKNVDIWKRPIEYIGVDTQYFAALVHPVENQLQAPTVDSSQAEVVKEGPKPQYADLSVLLTSKPHKLGPRDDAASSTATDTYQLYVGPKRPVLLSALKADHVLDYGWFGRIVVLMLWILNGLHGLGVNYGLAIIGLTCLVRAAIFPLSRYQSHSMDKMKDLQPKIKVLHEKYKKNPESLTREEMRTMQEVQFKMMWGCLPLFAQMPIFIALYRALQVSVDLRMAPLHLIGNKWIDNLAAPDALFQFGFALPFVGWSEFNLLPVITVVLFIVNQKLTMPPPADEEQEMQYKMMNVMMGVMGFMFYRVPSGLCLYFITSSIWGMTERMLLKKWSPAKSAGPAAATTVVAPEPPPAKPAAAAAGKYSMIDELKKKLRELQELADKPSEASREGKRKGRKSR